MSVLPCSFDELYQCITYLGGELFCKTNSATFLCGSRLYIKGYSFGYNDMLEFIVGHLVPVVFNFSIFFQRY